MILGKAVNCEGSKMSLEVGPIMATITSVLVDQFGNGIV